MPNESVNKLPSDAKLTLTLLGEASLSYVTNEQVVSPILGPGKPLAMLAYLARCPNKTAARDHLLGLLWGQHLPADARHALRQTVWYIRQRLGQSAIESGDGVVRMAAEVDCDVDRFLAAVESGEFDQAVQLYAGTLVPELSVPGGVEFDRWVDAESARLRSLFFRSAEVLVRRWLSSGQFQQAEKLARRVRDAAHYREAGWRLLLECLTSAGESVRAAVEAEELKRFLEADGSLPEPATLESIDLALATHADTSATASGKALVAELVGREREFSTIIRAWDRARPGTGTHIMITAAAGLGKTRLLSDAHARLRATGATVIHLRANPGERHISYAFASVVAEALAELPGSVAISPASSSTLAALSPKLSSRFNATAESVREHDLLRRRTIALSELLEAVAHEKPFVLLIDDLHWVDVSSLTVLGGVAGRIPGCGVLMVSASRPISDSPIHETASQQLTLSALTDEQVGALVNSMGNLGGAPWADRLPRLLQKSTGGSPLLVMETLLLALDLGWLELGDNGWSCRDEGALWQELGTGGALRRRVIELNRSEGWLLLLLAVAGTPLDFNRLAAMAHTSTDLLSQDLARLEQRGFLIRFGDEYGPAHDELAELSIDVAPEETQTAASGAVGRVLSDNSWDDLQKLTLAGRFLVRAGDEPRLRQVFRRCIWLARGRGDRRSLSDLGQELLGEHASNAKTARIVRSLPLSMRLGLTSAGRIAAAAALVVAAAGAIAWATLRPEAPPPDAVLFAIEFPSSESAEAFAVPIRRDEWDSSRPLHLDRNGIRVPELNLGVEMAGGLAVHPNGKAWAVSLVTADSGVIDLFLIEEGGSTRRLTYAPGDDTGPSWAPDGRSIVFQTCRWNRLCRYDLATLDVTTGAVAPLLVSDTTYHSAIWSPNGERIVYQATFNDGSAAQVCWVTVDGVNNRCYTHSDPAASVIAISWYGSDQLLTSIRGTEGLKLAVLSLETGQFTPLATPFANVINVAASVDGQWLAVRPSSSTAVFGDWTLLQTEHLELARQLHLRNYSSDRAPILFWSAGGGPSRYVDSVRIDGIGFSVPENAPYQFRAIGLSTTGDMTALPILTWLSTDSSIAVVDDRGRLVPRRRGTTTIVASAGGWRQDSLAISIGSATHETVFEEDWNDDVPVRWRVFGEPSPSVTTGPGGVMGFWNHGDGSFTSGAYTEPEFDGTTGIGLDLVLSAPITEDRWQNLEVLLTPHIDTVALSDWDHKSTSMPGSGNLGTCGFNLAPANAFRVEDPRYVDAVQIVVDVNVESVKLESQVRSGAWHRFRLQLFPDGSCGVAVDGVPLLHVAGSVAFERPFRLVLQGNSYETQMLHGAVEVWTGVRGDIDWRVVEHKR